MYNEGYVRRGEGMHHDTARHSAEVWSALAEFANKFMDYYDSEEHSRRAYYSGSHYDNARLGRRHDEDSLGREFMRYQGQPRTRTGRFKARFSGGRDMEQAKEMIAAMLAEENGRDWLIEKAISEASEFIKAATKEDEYEMFKEFGELCVLMKGVGQFVPEELEQQAFDKAIEYYAKKSKHGEYSNPLLEEYTRRSAGMY